MGLAQSDPQPNCNTLGEGESCCATDAFKTIWCPIIGQTCPWMPAPDGDVTIYLGGSGAPGWSSPLAETSRAVENLYFQAASKVVFRNGLAGVVGVGQLDAPLSNLPTPDTWIAVARKTTQLRLDPASDQFASLQASAEAFRSALTKRRQRDWQPQYDRINALMAVNEAHGGGDDDGTIVLASEYSRDCVCASLADFDAESIAFAGAIAKANGAEIDPHVGEQASKLLWRTRATHFLSDPAPIPTRPIVSMSVRDEIVDVPVAESNCVGMEAAIRAYEAEWDAALRDMINAQARAFTSPNDTPRVLRLVAAMVDRMDDIDTRALDAVGGYLIDPAFHWLRGVLVRRNPHAKEVIDAWLGVKRLLATYSDPAIKALIEPSEVALRSLTQEMRVSARKGWRANIVFGATPFHPDRARYSLETRMIAVQAEQQSLALLADIDRAAAAQRGNIGIAIARAARAAVEPVLGTLLDTEVGAEPISPDCPPQLGDAPNAAMLEH